MPVGHMVTVTHCLFHLNAGLNDRKLLLELNLDEIKIIRVTSYHFNKYFDVFSSFI